jgi:predicted TIM-barrel fold metal-dependent hydrolase
MKAIDVHAHVTPLFGYRRMLGDEIADAGYKPQVIEKVLYQNAQRILGIK